MTPDETPLRIAVVGASRSGLALAIIFAHLGHRVGVLDADPEIVGALRMGDSPAVEPAFAPLWRAAVRSGRLEFTTYATDALGGAELVLFAEPVAAAARERAARGVAPCLTVPALLLFGREPLDSTDAWLSASPADGATVLRPVEQALGDAAVRRANRLLEDARAFLADEMAHMRRLATACERGRARLLRAKAADWCA